MIVLGVDPGLHGGIAVMNGPAGVVAAYPMPILRANAKGARDTYDTRAICRLMQASVMDGPRGFCIAFVEKQGPLPARVTRKDGAVEQMGGSIANWNRGGSYRLFEGLLTGLGIPFEFVLPQVWQRAMLSGTSGDDTKQRSITAAQRLFPQVSLLPTLRSRRPSDGLSDALLLAAYAQRQLAGGPLFERACRGVTSSTVTKPY